MNFSLLIPLLSTSLITITGWYVLHAFAKKREERSKQRELRINYLIEAWRRLEFAANRKEFDPIEYLEKPIADIQLFGSVEQIKMAQQVATDMAESKVGNLNELLENLRQDLRDELKLEKTSLELKYLRIPQ